MCFCSEVDNSMLTYKGQVTIKSTFVYGIYHTQSLIQNINSNQVFRSELYIVREDEIAVVLKSVSLHAGVRKI